MKKRVNDVFEYLLDKNINTKEKEEFVNKKINKIIREINKQSSSKIMNYLFNRNLPNSVKVIISEEIDKLPYRRPNTSELNLEEIKMYIDEKNIVSESILSKEYYPNILKEIIIDKIYNKNILKNITDKSIDLKNKKIIIDLKVYEEEDIISLLKEEIPIELTNYIIDTKVTNVSIIQHTLSMYSGVSSEIKDEIIKKKINSKNIVDVLYSYLYTDELVERILDLKKESNFLFFIE